MKIYLRNLLGILCGALSMGGAIVLIGCDGSGLSSSERIISSGWAGVSNEDSEGQAPLYCYKTIGEPDCYLTPDPKRSAQLVSVYPAKNTARPIGVGKIFESAFGENDGADPNAIKEKELDKVRYYPTPEEKALSRKLEATRREKEVGGPIK